MKNTIKKAENYIIDLFNNKLDNIFLYHNLAHTQRVVSKAKELAETAKLTTNELEKLLIAAWFHDAGFTVNPKNHEEESSKIVLQF